MVDPQALSKVFSRTSWAALAVLLTLAWSAPAPAAPKRVGNADDAAKAETPPAADGAEDAPAKEAGDDAATESEGEAPIEEKVLPEDSAKELEELLKDAASGDDSKADGAKEPAASAEAKPEKAGEMDSDEAPGTEPGDPKADSEEPAKADGDTEKSAKPEAEASKAPAGGGSKSAKPATKKEKGKKSKDFVGKRDQKKDANGVYRFESGAYLITTDVEKDLANDIGAHMDAVYKEYWARLSGFRPNPHAAVKPNQKMPLYVMKRYRDYLTLLQGFGFNAANSGGVFFRTREGDSGLATWVEGQSRLKMYYVLQHEGFHQFADAKLMGSVQLPDGTVVELPPWVNEGLAEYFGDAVMVKGKMIIGRLDRERLNRMKRAIKEEITLPFRELMTMNNDRWVARVTAGDKASSLMYDSAWSVCYYLAHGNKKERYAIETYLRMLNDKFVTNPGKDPRGETFEFVFGNNLDAFEASWKAAVARMEPDAWFTSVRHLQWMAAALEEFHKKEIPVKGWDHLKEQLIRHRFTATIRERDIVARGERKEQVEHLEQDFDFPDPAQVEFRASDDPRLPHGLLITHVVPNILLSWSINADGVLEEDISYLDPPRGQIKKTAAKKPQKAAPVAKKPDPKPAKPNVKAAPKKADAGKGSPAAATAGSEKPGEKPAKKGVIRVGPQ